MISKKVPDFLYITIHLMDSPMTEEKHKIFPMNWYVGYCELRGRMMSFTSTRSISAIIFLAHASIIFEFSVRRRVATRRKLFVINNVWISERDSTIFGILFVNREDFMKPLVRSSREYIYFQQYFKRMYYACVFMRTEFLNIDGS